jgi:hypothetical protein
MIRLVLSSLSLALVAGCASTSPASTSAAEPAASGAQVADAGTGDRKQVCMREMPTGSNIPKNKCHDVQTDAERQRAVEFLRTPVPAKPPGHDG